MTRQASAGATADGFVADRAARSVMNAAVVGLRSTTTARADGPPGSRSAGAGAATGGFGQGRSCQGRGAAARPLRLGRRSAALGLGVHRRLAAGLHGRRRSLGWRLAPRLLPREPALL